MVDSVFFVSRGGFTTVVFFSVLFSTGAAGVTVSDFCSHAAKSAALAKMQISFFIDFDRMAFSELLLNRKRGLSGLNAAQAFFMCEEIMCPCT